VKALLGVQLKEAARRLEVCGLRKGKEEMGLSGSCLGMFC
jgi:hypothetical protein